MFLLSAYINFECSIHCDQVDEVSTDVTEQMKEMLKFILEDKDVKGEYHSHQMSSLLIIRVFLVSTTCCYQFLIPSKSKESKIKVI